MPQFLATYDLQRTTPDVYATFIEQAMLLGWNVVILSTQNHWYKLPNTTLQGEFQDQQAALSRFIAIAGRVEATGRQCVVEKYIVVGYTTSNFNSDVTFPNA